VLELFERIGFENLDRERYEVLLRSTRRTVELFREENVPLETELAKLDQKYDQICGAMSVEFEGEERTIPQMGRFLQVEDRDRRERAWRATAERRLQDKDAIDDIFDRMIELRHQIATNAGFDNYRDYEHARKQRFDYTPADCERFHAAVEQHVVPFMRRLDARRQDNLGVDTLRPWDLQVDEKGRPPLNPFETGQELIERTRTVFDGLDPQLAGLFRSLGDNATEPGGGEMLDLDSRKGKAFGGYQYHRDRTNRAFIFMNAAGLHRDVETMVHEAGHAFHSLLCADDPLIDYRNYPIEFAEVASMSMELLTMPKWEAYYPKEADGSAADRARRSQLEGSVSILAWIATIDAFQHWLYTHPEHTRAARLGAWLDISRRFGHAVSWEGLEDAEKWTWQRQGHLFGSPFYYIEYGIAQLGALGVWLRSLERGVNAALTDYKEALALGGSRPLPELFETAGVPFDFGPEIVGRLVNAVEGELAKLPE
jgi:oligoendopeptidase F